MGDKKTGIYIATLTSSYNSKYCKMIETDMTGFLGMLDKKTVVSPETMSEYDALTVNEKSVLKDVGGFIGARLKADAKGRYPRGKDDVVARTMITLDADAEICGDPDDEDGVILQFHNAFPDTECAIISTRKDRDGARRYRLMMFLDRECAPDEGEAISRYIAYKTGMQFFDTTTFSCNRVFYWPSRSSDQVITRHLFEGEPVHADDILGKYDDWTDVKGWARAPKESAKLDRLRKHARDPHEAPGAIGAFNRIYNIEETIAAFCRDDEGLPLYEQVKEERWNFIPGSSYGGVLLYTEDEKGGHKFMYSHHSTDPTSEELVNSYDLIRLVKFDGNVKACDKYINALPKVKAEVEGAKIAEAAEDFADIEIEDDEDLIGEIEERPTLEPGQMISRLVSDAKGNLSSNTANVKTILTYDKRLNNLFRFNSMNKRLEKTKGIPGAKRKFTPAVVSVDFTALMVYIEKIYGLNPKRSTIIDVVNDVAMQDVNTYNPAVDQWDALPKWDGIKRVDTVFHDYLNAEQSVYTAETAWIALLGAMIRGYRDEPIELHIMPTLLGPQGIGKSTFIKRLAMFDYWATDNLPDLGNKDAILMMHNYLFVEWAEIDRYGKRDAAKLKSFISTSADNVRRPYSPDNELLIRKCVFFATTNKDDFLTDVENRRYAPIVCDRGGCKSVWSDMRREVPQIWAEVKARYDDITADGADKYELEKVLCYTDEAKDIAKKAQAEHVETTDDRGQIESFLESEVPKNFTALDYDVRLNFWDDEYHVDDEQLEPRKSVCIKEIWLECLRRDAKDLTIQKRNEIKTILALLGWTCSKANVRKYKAREYGSQRVFTK